MPEAGEIEIVERAILMPAAGARPDTFAIAMKRPAERRKRLVARIAPAPRFRLLAALRRLRVVDCLLFRRDRRRLLNLLHVARMQRLHGRDAVHRMRDRAQIQRPVLVVAPVEPVHRLAVPSGRVGARLQRGLYVPDLAGHEEGKAVAGVADDVEALILEQASHQFFEFL
ncbi:hypothetical protein [Burkholderia lata]|uniref:hypothetical protein n=1 Tax=Burkholderia lata (strain ATCC 17760 / DSM 23089 / LMG 22485 / NCIMB 9086 / R18194 / 383) TaxID=482957 RepID=UPI00158238F0|nr:hypothetical protein [Burkholderia lata]